MVMFSMTHRTLAIFLLCKYFRRFVSSHTLLHWDKARICEPIACSWTSLTQPRHGLANDVSACPNFIRHSIMGDLRPMQTSLYPVTLECNSLPLLLFFLFYFCFARSVTTGYHDHRVDNFPREHREDAVEGRLYSCGFLLLLVLPCL